MSSEAVLDRDGVLAVVQQFRAAAAELLDLPLDVLGLPDLFGVLDATETVRCMTPVVEHDAINRIAAQATPAQIERVVEEDAGRAAAHPARRSPTAHRRCGDAGHAHRSHRRSVGAAVVRDRGRAARR